MNSLEYIKPLTNLCDSESCIEEDKRALNEILAVMNVNEFSTRHHSLIESQNNMVAEFEKFTKENAKEEKNVFLETETAVKNHLLSVSQNVQSLEKDITDVKSSLENYTQLGKASIDENIVNIRDIIYKTTSNITDSEEVLKCVASQLKDEILKRDIEFEKFISEDLLKDIPTGTTPQRKNYVYPRLLAATSPHDRILERYRSKLATDTAVAVNLPLDSSFNESGESSIPTDKIIDVVADVNNISISSDDSTSYDTDSCVSSLSDASIEGGRNKENKKNSKKKSRLPKRMPAKGFVKPAPPAMRKPLVVTNSDVHEHSDP